jgi:hypothetical protein
MKGKEERQEVKFPTIHTESRTLVSKALIFPTGEGKDETQNTHPGISNGGGKSRAEEREKSIRVKEK